MEIRPNPPESPQVNFPINRVVFMLVLMGAFGAGIVILWTQGTRKSSKLTLVEKAPKEADDFGPELHPDDPIRLPPALAAQIDEKDGHARSTREEKPWRELMSQLYNRNPLFIREVLKYREADYDSILRNPAAARGETLFVRGTLVDFGERALDKPLGDYLRVHFGVVKDNQGNLFWFESLAFDDEHIHKLGQVVLCEGVFFKVWKYIRVETTPINLHELPEQVDNLPMMLCRSVRRSFRIQEVTELNPRLVRSVQCSTNLEQEHPLASGPFYHLLGYMQNLPIDRIPKKIQTYDDMVGRLDNPNKYDKFRGEWVSFWGRLGPIYKHLDEENPAGVKHHYRAIVSSSDRRVVMVVLSDKPEGFEIYQDVVQVKGIFFRPYCYETDTDGRYARIPVVVAKRMTKVKFSTGAWAYIAMGMGALLAAALLCVGFVIYRERRAIKEHHDRFIQRRRERRLKALNKAEEAAKG